MALYGDYNQTHGALHHTDRHLCVKAAKPVALCKLVTALLL